MESLSSATAGRCSGGSSSNLDDATGLVEIEHVIEEGDEDVLVLLGAEDPFEGEVGLGVGEGGAGHGDLGDRRWLRLEHTASVAAATAQKTAVDAAPPGRNRRGGRSALRAPASHCPQIRKWIGP
jgi:hypothetical protein